MLDFKLTEVQNDFKKKLHETDLTVVFTKKDGSLRTMICTLAESKIPEEKRPKHIEPKEGEKPRVLSNDVARVFDIEKSEWRSFRWDAIINVEGL
jgi:hypothetical protein